MEKIIDKAFSPEEKLKKVMEKFPNSKAWLTLAKMYIDDNEHAKAFRFLEKEILKHPGDWEGFRLLARIYHAWGDQKSARQVMDVARGLHSQKEEEISSSEKTEFLVNQQKEILEKLETIKAKKQWGLNGGDKKKV